MKWTGKADVLMEWSEKRKRLTVGLVLIGIAGAAITTVVMASGMGGGPGGGGAGGGPGGGAGKMDQVEKSKSIISVKLTTPEIGSLTRNTEFIGKIESAGTISVYPESSGKVGKLYVDEGDYVMAGDLLLEQDTSDLEFDMEVAVASYESTIASANKTLGSDYTSKILNAENSVEKNQESYRTARLQYKDAIDSEDDNIDRKMELMDQMQTAMEESLDAYNQAKKDPDIPEEELDALYKKYQTNRDSYNQAADLYAEALEDYDDEKSTVAASKNNAYKDLVKAQNDLELTMGEAYQEQKAVIEAQLKSARLSLEKAQRALDKAYLFSPVSGKIETSNVEDYGTISTNTAAFLIKNDDTVQLTFNASSDGAGALSLGDPVTVTKGGKTYDAAITEIASEADSSTGLFEVKARLPEDADLLPGVTVKVSAATAKAENALLVPIDQVYYDEAQPYVFTYEDGKARRVDITTGMSDDTAIVAETGLTPSSLIITTWHPDLADGVEVVLAEGQSEVVEAAKSAPALETSSTEEAQADTEPQTASPSKASSREEQDGEDTDYEIDLLEDSETLASSRVGIPEEPEFPDQPVMKDLSYPKSTTSISDAVAKAIAESEGTGLIKPRDQWSTASGAS